MTKRFDDAFLLASELHRAQVRKGTTIPYISHLMAVSAIVLENDGDEDQAIAALLHDAAENQGGRDVLDDIRRRFGPGVAQIVEDCTDARTDPKPAWRQRKEAYLEHLKSTAPRSLLVSLADKTHNARAILLDHGVIGPAIWKRFNAGRPDMLWYYGALSTTFLQRLPGRLSDELARTLFDLNACG